MSTAPPVPSPSRADDDGHAKPGRTAHGGPGPCGAAAGVLVRGLPQGVGAAGRRQVRLAGRTDPCRRARAAGLRADHRGLPALPCRVRAGGRDRGRHRPADVQRPGRARGHQRVHPRAHRGAALPGRHRGRRRRVLPQARAARLRAGRAGGGALERHGRGSGRRELRRTTGDLPVDPRRRRGPRAHASLHLEPVHRAAPSPTAPTRGSTRVARHQRGRAEDGQCLHGRCHVHHPPGQRRPLGDRHRRQLRLRRIGGLGRGDARPLRGQQDHARHHRPHDLAQAGLLHGRHEDADLAPDRKCRTSARPCSR